MTSVSSTSSSTTSTTYSTDPSTFDWSGLIDDMVATKTATADTISTKITANEARIAAYQKLQSLLADVKTAAEALRNPESSLSDNAFESRTATITSNGDVSASAALAMTVENGTASGSYNLQIEQLAQAQKVASAIQTSESTALGYSGVFSIGLADGTSADVTVDSGMSLQDLVDAINTQSSTTDVQASIIQVSSSQYEMVLTATTSGEDIVTSSTSGDDVLTNLGVTDSSGAYTDELQAAQKAKIKLDNIEITRDSNDISDVVGGATFHLYQTTPTDTSLTIAIGSDTSTVETAINSLVTAYNTFRDYAYTQQQTDTSGAATSDAVLFGDGTLRNISNQVAAALNTTVNSLSLSTLGLSFNETNELELDSSVLESALASNLDGVSSLLEFQATVSSSDLQVVSRGTASPTSFTLDLAVDSSGNLTSASVGGDSSLFTVSGTTILGKAGTAYDGFAFAYTGTSSKSIDVTLSSGIGELLYNIADAAADTTSGTLQTVITSTQTTDTALQQRVDDITSQAETYRSTLTAQYAKYQAAILEAQSTLTYLKTLLNSGSSNS
jgi:flagellar hook-associated protein 2